MKRLISYPVTWISEYIDRMNEYGGSRIFHKRKQFANHHRPHRRLPIGSLLLSERAWIARSDAGSLRSVEDDARHHDRRSPTERYELGCLQQGREQHIKEREVLAAVVARVRTDVQLAVADGAGRVTNATTRQQLKPATVTASEACSTVSFPARTNRAVGDRSDKASCAAFACCLR